MFKVGRLFRGTCRGTTSLKITKIALESPLNSLQSGSFAKRPLVTPCFVATRNDRISSPLPKARQKCNYEAHAGCSPIL
ncbi:hypothetical protein DBV15_11541 [Temnothorax longispinosus]|uniref:Uncharacterized protein n=1 Tax=Temnothorax longispinosus TaxID=300112 RepID=A0A4S2KF90_9HYME|nr:hypothetical protein DBV15_11541 [Temnothorax longispinosus]